MNPQGVTMSFTEQLPATRAAKQHKRFVHFCSLAGLGVSAGGRPVLGVVELQVVLSKNRTQTCRYILTEHPTNWPGRAFGLKKADATPGSDDEASSYDVFIGSNGQDRQCHCRGFLQHGQCKHTDAIVALLQNDRLSN